MMYSINVDKKVTVCLSYYNQSSFLRKTVLNWKSYPESVRDSFTFLIVDDHSRETATDVLNDIDLSDLDLHIYRVEKDLYCNIAGVRNLSARECKTEWIFMVDMDTWVDNDVNEKILSLVNGKTGTSQRDYWLGTSRLSASAAELMSSMSVAYKFNRKYVDSSATAKEKVHPAVCLIKKEDYWRVGGCNENLVGQYGGTDADFWRKVEDHKLFVCTLHDTYLIHEHEGCCEHPQDIDRENGARKHEALPSPPEYVRFPWKKIH